MKIYHKLCYRLDQRDSYLIWYGTDTDDEQDGVLLHQAGNVLVFGDESSLETYAKTLGSGLENEKQILYNFDLIQKWLDKPRKDTIDCVEFLNAWNLFEDIATSVDRPKLEAKFQTGKIYDKLFWGNNLPAMTPPGKSYTTLWSNQEAEKIEEVMRYGLKMFREKVSWFKF